MSAILLCYPEWAGIPALPSLLSLFCNFVQTLLNFTSNLYLLPKAAGRSKWEVSWLVRVQDTSAIKFLTNILWEQNIDDMIATVWYVNQIQWPRLFRFSLSCWPYIVISVSFTSSLPSWLFLSVGLSQSSVLGLLTTFTSQMILPSLIDLKTYSVSKFVLLPEPLPNIPGSYIWLPTRHLHIGTRSELVPVWTPDFPSFLPNLFCL